MSGEHGDEPASPEPVADQLNRNMGELLQELRVAQAGVQILFAFLLSVTFAAQFGIATGFQRGLTLVTILLTAASSLMLMAPAAWHRVLFRKGRRREIIRWANRVALVGLALLALAMTGVVLLVSDVIVGGWVAVVITVCSGLAFGSVWFVVPTTRLLRPTGQDRP